MLNIYFNKFIKNNIYFYFFNNFDYIFNFYKLILYFTNLSKLLIFHKTIYFKCIGLGSNKSRTWSNSKTNKKKKNFWIDFFIKKYKIIYNYGHKRSYFFFLFLIFNNIWKNNWYIEWKFNYTLFNKVNIKHSNLKINLTSLKYNIVYNYYDLNKKTIKKSKKKF